MVAYEVARDNFLDEHVKLIRSVYRERRDVMLEALARNFPPEVTWTRPNGRPLPVGDLPEGPMPINCSKPPLRENVAFVPGDCFYAPNGHGDDGRRHMRLNFSAAAPDQIREGIRRPEHRREGTASASATVSEQ